MPQQDALSGKIQEQAEFELAAFLKAATDVIGQSVLSRAGDTWLQVMETLDWPEEDYERFFRKVTGLAISQLLRNSENEATHEKRRHARPTDWAASYDQRYKTIARNDRSKVTSYASLSF